MDKIAFDLVKGKTFLLIFTVAFKNQRRPPGAGFYANKIKNCKFGIGVLKQFGKTRQLKKSLYSK